MSRVDDMENETGETAMLTTNSEESDGVQKIEPSEENEITVNIIDTSPNITEGPELTEETQSSQTEDVEHSSTDTPETPSDNQVIDNNTASALPNTPSEATVSEDSISDAPSKSPPSTDSLNGNQSSEPLNKDLVKSSDVETEGATSSQSDPTDSIYHIKWITFNGSRYPVVTQNENGPCPLLAVVNLLILQSKVKLPAMIEVITSGQLMQYLGDCIFENAPKDISEDALLNYEQNMSDAMAVFHNLQTGLDVNVRFTGVSDFEYTRECIVFDLLGIRLYHGWLVDPSDLDSVRAVGNCSYNQLVEKIIVQKQSSDEALVTEALVAEEFLNRSASQLTYHGLCELSSTLNEEQMCVFFRNNHFSTLYRHNNELFLLVTDQGFLTESNVVWETLLNVEGDGHFVDAELRTYRKAEPSTANIPPAEVPAGSPQQVDQDYLVALSLQQEQQEYADQREVLPPGGADTRLSDRELAERLQEEESRRLARQRQQAANQQHLSQQYQQAVAEERERKKDKSDCIIL